MRNRRTFTLVELLIGVAVLGVLATIAFVGYGSVTSKAADNKMIVRSTSVLKEAQVLYKQKSFTDPTYTWTQAVADAVDDLPPYVSSAWSEGAEATGLSSGSNGWTVTLDTGVAVFSSAPNEFVVYEVNDTVYVASAVSSDDVTRAVYGYVSSSGAPRVWIAKCGGSTCDARTPTVGEPVNNAYPVGTRVASVPGDVRSVTIALASGSYIDVVMSFSAPTDDGGAAIDSYRGTCTSSNGGLTRLSTNPTSPVTVADLTLGKEYTCTAAAHNNTGWGAETTSSTALSIMSPPDAPAISSITGSVSSLTVAYTLGTSDGGSAIATVQYSLDSGAWVAFSGTTSPQTITGLTAGSSYSVRIRSVNAAAPSAASVAVSGSAYSVPGAPTITGITGTDGALSVSFTAPSSNGGSAITSYEYSLDSGAWVAFSGTTSAQAISSLSIQAYSVRIRAVNAIGAGSASAAVSGTANGAPPAPGSFSAAAASSSQINLSWTYTDPGDLSSFTVLRSDGTAIISSIAKASRSASVTGLTQNTAYSYYVVAVDAAGNTSSASATGTATTSNGPPPMSTITWEDSGALADSTFNHRVCWASDATSEVTKYHVVIDDVVKQTMNRDSSWDGRSICSGWYTGSFWYVGSNNSWYVQAVDGAGATTNSNTRTVTEGYHASAVYGWVEVTYSNASTTLTINGCSDAGQVYRDPYYNRVDFAAWDATIARGGTPWYDLTSGTRAMQRRTSAGYAGWGPVGINPQSYWQSRTEGYQSASGSWSGYWGSRATPGVSPCYWNTTYPTKFVTTIGYYTRAWQVTSAAWTVNPVYG